MRTLGLAIAIALVAAATAGAQQPRIYSSLPLQAVPPDEPRDLVAAMQLAVEEAGSPVEYISLDDSSTDTGRWEVEQVADNARRAARDPRTIAYLGEFNSGASVISIPILNDAGILQVSPTNTYVGLTRAAGAEPDFPDALYPSGKRTYGRVSLADHLQARALAAAVRERRIVVLDDAEVYGAGIAGMFARRARPRLVGRLTVDTRGAFKGLARTVRRKRPTAIVFGGITQNNAVRLWRALHRAMPRARLYGFDGVADRAFTTGISRGARRRTRIIQTPLPYEALLPAGRAFADRFTARFGHVPSDYAIYGYEAMRVALDVVAAGTGDRDRTIDAFFATRDRDSVLGRYSIDANGDPTSGRFGLYGVSPRGALAFERVLSVP